MKRGVFISAQYWYILRNKTYNSIKWRQEHTDSFLGLLDWRRNIINEECLVVWGLIRKGGQREGNCWPFRDATTFQCVTATMLTSANIISTGENRSTVWEKKSTKRFSSHNINTWCGNSELLVTKDMWWDSTFICQLESQTGYGVTCQVHLYLKVSLYEIRK